jgi:hypothetical protein
MQVALLSNCEVQLDSQVAFVAAGSQGQAIRQFMKAAHGPEKAPLA